MDKSTNGSVLVAAWSFRSAVALAAFCSVLAPAARAHAYVMGERHITSDTVLKTDQYGSVVFDADDITLDCANHQVHISSASKPNCFSNQSKCAIVAYNHKNITIQNCAVVGGFDTRVAVDQSSAVTLDNVSATVTVNATAFHFEYTSDIVANQLYMLGPKTGMFVKNTYRANFSNIWIDSPHGKGVWSQYNNEDTYTNLIVWDEYDAPGFGLLAQHDIHLSVIDSEFDITDHGSPVPCSARCS